MIKHISNECAQSPTKRKIKLRLLIPISLCMFTLLFTGIITLYRHFNKNINNDVRNLADKTSLLFRIEQEEDAALLDSLINFLQKDINIQNAWLEKDRPALLNYTSKIFEEFRSKYDITHFYFHQPDRICFLRVHELEMHGDYIDRFTMDKAVKDGKCVWGIELGPLGTFTLRVVSPWWINGRLEGYIELGKEVNCIKSELTDILGIELFFIINKSYLNRTDWEKGREMLGLVCDWDRFSQFVCVGGTMDQLPSGLCGYLKDLKECESQEHLSSIFKLSVDKHKYRGKSIALIDAGGRDVGDMLVLWNVDVREAAFLRLVILFIGACSTVSAILMLLFYLYINRIEQQLQKAYYDLEAEIGQHRKAEDKLKYVVKEWRTTFDSISDLVSIHDRDSNIIRANKSFAEVFKMKPSEIIGKKCYELIHGMKESSPFCSHKKAIDSGLPQTITFFEPHLGIHLEVTASPVFDENGQVSATVHIAKDISERREAEKRIADLAKFPSENPNPILRISRDGIVMYANRAAENLLEIHKGDSEKDVPENWFQIVQNVFDSGSTKQIEFECNQQILSFTFMPVLDSGYVNIYGLDITQRKQFEEEQTRLLQKVEHANRELNDFAHIVSHDLKAPLRGIKTLADWLTSDYQDKLGQDGREHLNMMAQRVKRMSDMIDGILGYSRVVRTEAEKITVDLNELIPEIIDIIAPTENIAITIDSELPVIEFEHTKIIQVFQNLLSNAVKYMDKPQGRISINCSEEESFWKFSINDNGQGIREKDFERIFQIFQTLSDSDGTESTGVGLTVVKKIIEFYGGNIWVQSNLGEGSTFFFTLPKQEIVLKV